MARSRPSNRRRLPRSGAVAIVAAIRTLRGERVILDADLARIYGVETRVLKQAVRRNHDKFPSDFLFELTSMEAMNSQHPPSESDGESRSQIVILKRGRNVKHVPYAFTEYGAIMAANILNSPQAVQMNVFVVRAFVNMRGVLTDTRELARKLAVLEDEIKAGLDTHESAIVDVLQRIMELLDPPAPFPQPPQREMGFHSSLALKSTGKR